MKASLTVPSRVDQQTAPVEALTAYIFASPPPTNTALVPFTVPMACEPATPAELGSHWEWSATPRNVSHTAALA